MGSFGDLQEDALISAVVERWGCELRAAAVQSWRNRIPCGRTQRDTHSHHLPRDPASRKQRARQQGKEVGHAQRARRVTEKARKQKDRPCVAPLQHHAPSVRNICVVLANGLPPSEDRSGVRSPAAEGKQLTALWLLKPNHDM